MDGKVVEQWDEGFQFKHRNAHTTDENSQALSETSQQHSLASAKYHNRLFKHLKRGVFRWSNWGFQQWSGFAGSNISYSTGSCKLT